MPLVAQESDVAHGPLGFFLISDKRVSLLIDFSFKTEKSYKDTQQLYSFQTIAR